MKGIFFNLIVVSVVFLAQGCSKNEIFHGYTFNDVQNFENKMHMFEKNKASLQHVEEILGSPTFSETIQGKYEYFYVQNVFIKQPIIGSKKSYSKVLRILFDQNKRVENIKLYNVTENDVFDSTLKTKVSGNELKFFDQVKRNLGNIK